MTYSFKIFTFLAEVTTFYLERPQVLFFGSYLQQDNSCIICLIISYCAAMAHN